jgi:hypothetical protein
MHALAFLSLLGVKKQYEEGKYGSFTFLLAQRMAKD